MADRTPVHFSYQTEGLEPVIEAARDSVRSGQGLAVILSGATPAQKQEVIAAFANRLKLEIHQIDLAVLVGETRERTQGNLREKFDNNNEPAVVLFLDGADMFLRRTTPEDEPREDALSSAGYLFRRMESYGGIAVLCIDDRTAVASIPRAGIDYVLVF